MQTIDPKFILGIAAVSEFGARKYHMRNFLMAPGMEWSKVYGSLMRHLLAYWSGEEYDVGPNGEYGPTDDPDTDMKWSGLPHIDMVAWNVMVLCTYRNHSVYHPGDDRPSTIEYEGGIWKEWEERFNTIRQIASSPEPTRDPEPALEPAEAARAPSFMKDPLRAGMMRQERAAEEPPFEPMDAMERARVACNEAGFNTKLDLLDGKIVLTVHDRT